MLGAMLLHHAEPALLDELIEAGGRRGAGARIGAQAAFHLGLAEQIVEVDAGLTARRGDRRLDAGPGADRSNAHRVPIRIALIRGYRSKDRASSG